MKGVNVAEMENLTQHIEIPEGVWEIIFGNTDKLCHLAV